MQKDFTWYNTCTVDDNPTDDRPHAMQAMHVFIHYIIMICGARFIVYQSLSVFFYAFAIQFDVNLRTLYCLGIPTAERLMIRMGVIGTIATITRLTCRVFYLL